jgi:hypothetical protein
MPSALLTLAGSAARIPLQSHSGFNDLSRLVRVPITRRRPANTLLKLVFGFELAELPERQERLLLVDHLAQRKAASRTAPWAMMRALSWVGEPAGWPLIKMRGFDHTGSRGQPPQRSL